MSTSNPRDVQHVIDALRLAPTNVERGEASVDTMKIVDNLPELPLS